MSELALLELAELRWPVVLAGVYALFAAAALTSWWLIGDTWWNQVVNLSTFWWALPSLPLLLLALVFRQWGALLLLLVPAGLLLWAYGGFFLPSLSAASSSAPGQAGLRVVTYNVFMHAGGVAHVADLVDEEQPDVLFVQEVTGDRADELTDRVKDELPHSWFGEPDVAGGVGLLSRHPIEEVRSIPGAERFERTTSVVVIRVPVGEGTQRVQMVPVHLVAACPWCGEFVNRQRYEVESRRRQISAILGALDPDLPAVVGGDLNGTRRSDAYRALVRAGFRDTHTEAGSGLGLTYPAKHASPQRGPGDDGEAPAGEPASQGVGLAHIPLISFPVLRLDHVLVRDLVPVDARRGAPRASDHHPVVADLAWPTGLSSAGR